MAAAAAGSGRLVDEVTLVAGTKYVSAAEAVAVFAAGCRDLGESPPPELWTKAGEVALATGESPRWHLIGHLQRNKVRRTLPLVSFIHSVDSERLLAAIDEEARAQSLPSIRVLLEINTSGEAAKHGLAPDAVEPLLAAAPRFPHVAICGLMTMAALAGGPDVARRNFASLRDLRDRLRPSAPESVQLNELSMGMSGDFEAAIEEGATIVRVGTALWEQFR